MPILKKLWHNFLNFPGRGVFVTLVSLLVFHALTYGGSIRIVNPAYFFIIPVVYAATSEGLGAAFFAATISLLYGAYFFSELPIAHRLYFIKDDVLRITGLAISTYGVILLVGFLKKRNKVLTAAYKENIEGQLHNAQLLYTALGEAAPDFMWSVTPEGIVDYANKSWKDYTGIEFSDFSWERNNPGSQTPKFTVETFQSFFYEPDKQNMAEFWSSAWKNGSSFFGDFRYKKHDGSYRWFSWKLLPVNMPDGKIIKWVGTATDIHKQKMHEALAGVSSQELQTILGSITDGVVAIDIQGKLIYANTAAASLCGFATLEDFIKTPLADIMNNFTILDEEGGQIALNDFPTRRAMRGENPPPITVRFVPKNNPTARERWALVQTNPVFDSQQKVAMVLTVFKDITQLKENELQARRVSERELFLAKSSELLSSSLNYEETLKSITYLAVPKMADWAAVDMWDGQGPIERLAVAHSNPAKISWAYELSLKYPVNIHDTTGLAHVLKNGVTEFYPVITDEMIVHSALDEEYLKIIREIGFTSVIIVPIKILNKTVGAITFVNAESGVHFTEDDVRAAEELARRASLAIQNAKLYKVAQEAAEKEHSQAELLNTLLSNAPIGVAFLNTSFEFVLINDMLARNNGLPVKAHIGKNILHMFPEFEHILRSNLESVLESGQPVLNYESSGELGHQPGKMHHWYTSYYPVRDQNQHIVGIGMIVQEITQQREAEKEIYFRAYHDPLTHLPNRKAFEERLLKVLHRAKSGGYKFAVMFLDMDRLKDINDGLGHDVGDEVLKEIAGRLTKVLRAEDTVARWGGDEFVVLLPEIFGSQDASRVAEKILAAIEPAMLIKNHSLHITASIGIAIFPHDGEDIQALQKNADTALYRAKDAGRNTYELYTFSMNVKAGQRIRLENDLRQALKQKQFIIFYQPVLELKNREIKSVEALLRWRHPQLGILHPGKFLSIAEDIGLIVPLGKWVLHEVAKDIKYLQSKNFDLQAAVNISPRQFSDDNLVGHILDGLDSTGVSPAKFDIEITESLAMENLDRTKTKLMELRGKGMSITVDDFGTGYSSLNYLKRLPIDRLKIDKSFVRHIITDEQDTSIIKAIISMAKSLHLKVIAEGVDSEMQLHLLASLGCDSAQGFYISKPLSRKELMEYLAAPKVLLPSPLPQNEMQN